MFRKLSWTEVWNWWDYSGLSWEHWVHQREETARRKLKIWKIEFRFWVQEYIRLNLTGNSFNLNHSINFPETFVQCKLFNIQSHNINLTIQTSLPSTKWFKSKIWTVKKNLIVRNNPLPPPQKCFCYMFPLPSCNLLSHNFIIWYISLILNLFILSFILPPSSPLFSFNVPKTEVKEPSCIHSYFIFRYSLLLLSDPSSWFWILIF